MAMDIRAKLAAARMKQAAAPNGRAVVRLEEINVKDGTGTGEVISGLGVGEKITFKFSGKLEAADYTKGRTKVDLNEGTIQIEGLKKSGDVYDTRWVKTFRPKNDEQTIESNAVFTLRSGKTRGGDDYANLNEIKIDDEKFVNTVDDMKAAMIAAIDAEGAATLMVAPQGSSPVIHSVYAKSVKAEDGTYSKESGQTVFDRFDSEINEGQPGGVEAVFSEALGSVGVSIVPTRSIRIGNGTWDAVQESLEANGTGGPVNLRDLTVTSVAIRLTAAYTKMEVEADQQAVREAFLAGANADATAKFLEKGFAGVEPRDIEKFLADNGQKMVSTPRGYGFAQGAYLTKAYDTSNPDSDVMVTKTFATSAAAPFPKVEAFKAIREEYYQEADKVLANIAAMHLSKDVDGPGEDKAGVAEEKKDVKAKAAAEPKPDPDAGSPAMDDIDDLLAQVGDDLDTPEA